MPAGKRVVREDGMVYKSARAAAKSVGKAESNMSVALKKGTRCGGYYWKYLVDNVDNTLKYDDEVLVEAVFLKDWLEKWQNKKLDLEFIINFRSEWEFARNLVRKGLEHNAKAAD